MKSILYIIIFVAIFSIFHFSYGALDYRALDIMKLTKDTMRVSQPDLLYSNHIETIKSDMPTMTHIGISFVNNTQAETVTEGVGSFYEEPWTRKNRVIDMIHGQGMNVLDRATDSYFEGLYDFPKTDKRNGNRYTYFATNITDNFSSGTRTHGYGKTSADGNLSTNYLTSHQSGNTWSISGGELVAPAPNGWVRTILFDAPQLRDVTMTAKVKKVGNQQIVVRATTDSNFPGYGLQMRDTNILRIERPGLENLGETAFTWVEGNYYWLKLEAVGTTIRGKAWAVGDSEPGSWTISLTNSTYTNGYSGFSGESNGGIFDDMTITPAKDTDTWMARYLDKVVANISHFTDGDILSPYPEATSHFPLTNQGSYNQFFSDMDYSIERVGIENGKVLEGGMVGHLFTNVLQGSFNDLFTAVGTASYDHYGTSLGRGKVWFCEDDSCRHDTGAAGGQTYTVPTSITENATNRQDFIPEKVAYNKGIRVYVVNKGTGNWTMTIHDPNGNPVKMYDNTDLNISNNSYQVTISNANLTNGAWNDFLIDWVNLETDQTHHFHLTSTVGDGTVKTTSANDLNNASYRMYKWHAIAEALEIDIRNAYQDTGVPQFLQEWGDYWSTDAGLTDPVLNQSEHITYLQSIYAAMQRLVDDGILVGFNYWASTGGEQAIYNEPSSPNYIYTLTYEGEELQTFFNNNPDSPPVSSTTTIASINKGTLRINNGIIRFQ